MRFVPCPDGRLLFSVWETRVQDYDAFRTATRRAWSPPSFRQGPTHPVVNVTWEDAAAFCAWLTDKERTEGRLTSQGCYRLPTDGEWSLAVGVGHEEGITPEARMKSQKPWPWGSYWPPLAGDGNYGPELKTDACPDTAPVGSFRANALGVFDLGGNVWEWCDDWFNETRVTRVLRGGSFSDTHPASLLSAYRFNGTMNLASEDIGFRVVLAGAD
jgi:formylglycine-generating enzyme required for sulfatase activity